MPTEKCYKCGDIMTGYFRQLCDNCRAARSTADDSLPASASHIQSVPTPSELIRAGEEAMEKEMRDERRKPMP